MSGIRRQEAVSMDALIERFIRELKLASGLNRQRIYAAWDLASGASRYTLDRYFDRGSLVITISSAMARNSLFMQKNSILDNINRILLADELFSKKEGQKVFVRNLILK